MNAPAGKAKKMSRSVNLVCIYQPVLHSTYPLPEMGSLRTASKESVVKVTQGHIQNVIKLSKAKLRSIGLYGGLPT